MGDLLEFITAMIIGTLIFLLIDTLLNLDSEICEEGYLEIKEMSKQYNITENINDAMKDNKITIYEFQNIKSKYKQLKLEETKNKLK